jgi:hypothetical protein
LATTRDPAPTENRISVAEGVSDAIFSGFEAIVTAVPWSSVTVIG